MSLKQPHNYWKIATVVWAGVIFWFSSQPHLPAVVPDPWTDLVMVGAHFVEYFILTLCIDRGWARGRLRWQWVTIVVVALYAASDEWHQSFVPGRIPSVADLAVDLTAGLVYVISIQLRNIYGRQRRHSKIVRGRN